MVMKCCFPNSFTDLLAQPFIPSSSKIDILVEKTEKD